MARSRRRTSTSQRIARVAAVGMPYPLRLVFGTRIGASLLVIGLPLLLITGVMTIEWDATGPHFRFNRDRAQVIKQEAVNTVKKYEGQLPSNGGSGLFGARPGYDGGWTSAQAQASPQPANPAVNPATSPAATSTVPAPYLAPPYPTTPQQTANPNQYNPRYQPQYPTSAPYTPASPYGASAPGQPTTSYPPYGSR